jgi:hypothetical protein
MVRAILVGVIALLAPLRSGAEGAPAGRTPTVQVLGLEIRAADVVVSPKPGYAHLLWDVFPAREAVRAAAKARAQDEPVFRRAVALALAQALVPKAAPGRATVKVDVVEFPERDEYGEPRWSSVKKLQKFDLRLTGTARAEAPVPSPASAVTKERR